MVPAPNQPKINLFWPKYVDLMGGFPPKFSQKMTLFGLKICGLDGWFPSSSQPKITLLAPKYVGFMGLKWPIWTPKYVQKTLFFGVFSCKIHGMDGEDGEARGGANSDMGEMGQGGQCTGRMREGGGGGRF